MSPEARNEDAAAGEGASAPVDKQPVVEGEAVELTASAPESPAIHHSAPGPMPFPVAEQPVAVASPGPGPDPVTPLGDSAEAFASGHAATPGTSWQEPLQALVDERPEVLVGAAFAGGLLTAMILRRLGN
ncbi:MAG: hypothetical protein Q8O56_01295 [Solirubrobacteraceae bacterium]|nr:hypothetical protein [Solirubrobacteraceae bacterium]